MKRALYKIAFDKTVAQLGIAVSAIIVDGKNAVVDFENGDVMTVRRDINACTFKQICLSGYVNPVAHD
jgi:hypothetical protein